MANYLFISTSELDDDTLSSYASLEASWDDSFEIQLNNINELEILLKLHGIDSIEKVALENSNDFTHYIDISKCMLPEFTLAEYNDFYKNWLAQTQRADDMDEYGQLIFLHSKAKQWNQNDNNLILIPKLG